MKAGEANLLKFLQGSKQFVIPIYQRKYSWALEQCEQLWHDIVRVAQEDSIQSHFVGSIVYIESGLTTISSPVPQYLVIDGQQRLTTITLLLSALEGQLNEQEITVVAGVNSKKMRNYYLVNNDEEGDLFHRLKLTQSDNETLWSLIEGRVVLEPAPAIDRNYRYFKEKIKSMSISLEELYQGLSKLVIVDVALNRTTDNPQLIFESLNSTGLDLSQADLVRNFLLMGLEPREQSDLYKRHWRPIELKFGNLSDSQLFDRFMRDYLTIYTGKIPNIRRVYLQFKEYMQGNKAPSIEEVLKDLHRYSNYYALLQFQQGEDKEINTAFKDISTLKVDVSYPFLLEAYRLFDEGALRKDELLSVIRVIESYVFRRAICGVPTNSLNQTFSLLLREVKEENFVENLKIALKTKPSYRRFPNDAEFSRELKVKDVYSFRNRNYLLRKLENEGRKEPINISEYTVEHVMPQNENLPKIWREDLGPDWKMIQENYLHTIGNLTLTGYNSEMSDSPFSRKLTMVGGFKESPLRLNYSIGQQSVWNRETIEKRAEELVLKATEIWKYPEVSIEAMEEFKPIHSVYTIENYGQLKGNLFSIYEELSKEILETEPSIREEFTKLYIAYKLNRVVVDIVPQKSRLRVSIGMPFEEVNDPKSICRDVSQIGRWGNGDVEFYIENSLDIPYAMELIKQGLDYQLSRHK